MGIELADLLRDGGWIPSGESESVKHLIMLRGWSRSN
jgi:hypothetical protein